MNIISETELNRRLSLQFDNVQILDYNSEKCVLGVSFSAICRYCNNSFNGTVNASNLYGRTKSCGCVLRANGTVSSHWKGSSDGKIFKSHYSSIVRAAKSRGIIFSLSINEVAELLKNQEYRCRYTDLEIWSGSHPKDRTASLDRIDSNLGYTKTNVQWVHKDINMMKGSLGSDEFVRYCSLVSSCKH